MWRVPSVADLGVLYPILLFTLPNYVQLPQLPAAPETLLLVALLPVIWLTEVRSRYPRLPGADASQVLGICLLAGALLYWGLRGTGTDVAKVVLWLATFVFGIVYASDLGRLRAFWFVWLWIACLAALILLVSPDKWGEKTVDIFAWEHRTTYGYFLAVPTVVLLFQLLTGPSLTRLLRAGAFICVLLPALFLSYSRGAWLTVVIGVSVLLALSGLWRRALWYTASLIVAIAIAVVSIDSDFATLVRSLYDWEIRSSSLYRFDIYLAGVSASSDAGLFGTGPASAGRVLSEHTLQSYDHLDEERFATDSDVIWLLIEAGGISVLALLTVLFRYARRLRTPQLLVADPYAFTAALFIGFVAWISLDNVLMTPFGWFLLGTLWGALNAIEKTPKDAVCRVGRGLAFS